MNIQQIRRNIEQEIRLLEEIRMLYLSVQSLDVDERGFYKDTIRSLMNQIRMLNSAILPLIKDVSPLKPLTPSVMVSDAPRKRKLFPNLFQKKPPAVPKRLQPKPKPEPTPKPEPVVKPKLEHKPKTEPKQEPKPAPVVPPKPQTTVKSPSSIQKEKELKEKMKALEEKMHKIEKDMQTKQNVTQIINVKQEDAMKVLPKIQSQQPIQNITVPAQPLNVKYVSKSTAQPVLVTISSKDKDKFAKELKLSETNISKLKRKGKKKEKKKKDDRTAIFYAKTANKFFGSVSMKLAPQMQDLKEDLKLSNIKVLLQSYLSMALLTTSLLFIGVILLFIVLLIISPPLMLKNWYWILLPFASLAGFYFYPSLQKGGIEKGITSELPFATIYMSAIAGSNVEPIRIFKIIGQSDEYKAFGAETMKIVNQVELYGYDLVTALKNVAKGTTNRKFAELLEGMATNILSGGSLKNYLDKKAENFLMDYKLERQKYTAVAGTFMDIYISVLITAPLILMMVFVVIILTGMSTLPTSIIFIMSIGGVTLANIIFLVVLHLKQPAA